MYYSMSILFVTCALWLVIHNLRPPPSPTLISRNMSSHKVVLAEMSYRILLPDKAGGSAESKPSKVTAAGDRSDSTGDGRKGQPAAAAAAAESSGDALAATEEAAPCAGVWGDVEVRMDGWMDANALIDDGIFDILV